jgi:hypothetical protein
MDAAVMSRFRRQRRSPPASCAGLQSRQFPAHVGDAGADQGLVAVEPKGEADQDRREDRAPRPLCCVSDGRSGDSQKSLRRHFEADRRIAAASDSINRIRRLHVTFRAQPTGGLRPNDGKKHRHAPSDVAQGCQEPSAPSARSPIQPETGTVLVWRSSGGFRSIC